MRVKWLLIGTGDIVRKRVAGALGANLVGVCGGRDRAAAIADEWGASEVFDDVGQALADTQANAVYVATPVYRHAAEAIQALDAGKHVLIEKPLGLSGADAQRIVDAAATTDLRAGCAYYRRCFPRFEHLRRMVRDGELGRIVQVRTCYWGWFSPANDDPRRWRVQKERSGGGPLADMGSHMFDLLIALFDLPRTVFARCDTLVHDYSVEDSSAMVMTLANGAHVTASFGWNSRCWRHELEVVGSEASVFWSPADAGKVIITRGRKIEEVDLPSAANVHRPLVEDFESAISEHRDPVAPVAEAAKTNRLLDAIYRSADRNELVALT